MVYIDVVMALNIHYRASNWTSNNVESIIFRFESFVNFDILQNFQQSLKLYALVLHDMLISKTWKSHKDSLNSLPRLRSSPYRELNHLLYHSKFVVLFSKLEVYQSFEKLRCLADELWLLWAYFSILQASPIYGWSSKS